MPWLQVSAVLQVLLSAFLVTLVLMHSGREAGMGGLGFTPHSQGGTHIVERNLTRLTVVVDVPDDEVVDLVLARGQHRRSLVEHLFVPE